MAKNISYPLCDELGIFIQKTKDKNPISFINVDYLRVMLICFGGEELWNEFNKLFGNGHTQIGEGVYPVDVEKCLYSLRKRGLL